MTRGTNENLASHAFTPRPCRDQGHIMNPGFQAQDHRASLARAWSRIDRGETVERCGSCGTETDVVVPAHGVGCPENNQ